MSDENSIELLTAILPNKTADKWYRICCQYFHDKPNEFATVVTFLDELLRTNSEIEIQFKKHVQNSNE